MAHEDHCGDAEVALDASARSGLRGLSWAIAALAALALCASLALIWVEHVHNRQPAPECAVLLEPTVIHGDARK